MTVFRISSRPVLRGFSAVAIILLSVLALGLHAGALPSSHSTQLVCSTTTTTAPVAAAKAAPTPVAVVTPVTAPPAPPDAAAFLACVRQRESHGNYRAVSADGVYRGAYQFAQSSWDLTARHAGRNDLVGMLPDQASPADQDALALNLYQWQGAKPWGGACS